MPQSNSMLRVLRMFRWMTDSGQCNLGIAEPLLGGSDLGWLRPYLYLRMQDECSSPIGSTPVFAARGTKRLRSAPT